MKNIYLLLVVVLCFFSCKKDENIDIIDFSLLKQYNWKAIREKDTSEPFNSGYEIVKYADTAVYSFGEVSFNYYLQFGLVTHSFGSNGAKTYINYSKSVKEGVFKLNAADSTFQITYKYKNTYGLPWDIVPTEEIITTKYKILSLDKNSLRILVKPLNAGEPCFACNEETYFSISK